VTSRSTTLLRATFCLVCCPGCASAAPLAFAVNQLDSSVSIIDVATGTTLGAPVNLPTVGPLCTGVAVIPEGNKVFVACQSTVFVVDPGLAAVVGSFHTTSGPFLAVSPDGTRLYVPQFSNAEPAVVVYDTTTHAQVGDAIALAAAPYGIAASPDGKRIYTTNILDASVSVIDTATNAVVGAPITVGGTPEGLAVSPDARFVYVANEGDDSVSVIDAANLSVVGNAVPVGNEPDAVAIAPDGARVYVSNSGDNTVSVIDARALGNPAVAVSVNTHPDGIGVTPDGSQVYVMNAGHNDASVIDASNNAVIHTIPLGHAPVSWGPFFGPFPADRLFLGAFDR
jgi:YVTN family beta-propeller protein